MQVSKSGDLANWMIPSRGIGNVGGAMDLAVGAKKVIVAMEHNDKNGSSKIVNECSFPLTSKSCVSLIVTDIAVIQVVKSGLQLLECAPGWTKEDVQNETEVELIFEKGIKEFTL